MKLPVELQAGEALAVVCHRHPVYMIVRLAGAVLALLAPLAVIVWLDRWVLQLDDIPRLVIYAVYGLWAVYWLVRVYFIWYRHQNDLWIVTNQRLMDSAKRHWFDHSLSSADLVNLQDISIHRSGLLATLFNFGDVRCETAGSQSTFVLGGIPRPADTLTRIDALRDAARQGGGGAWRAPYHPDDMPTQRVPRA